MRWKNFVMLLKDNSAGVAVHNERTNPALSAVVKASEHDVEICQTGI